MEVLRPCVDYRHLNSITIQTDTHYHWSAKSRIGSEGQLVHQTDIADAYNQSGLRKENEWKQLSNQIWTFEYLVMPLINQCTSNFSKIHQWDTREHLMFSYSLPWWYLDLFTNQGTTHGTCQGSLGKIAPCKQRLRLKKCEFHVNETDFLGHRITYEGIQTD